MARLQRLAIVERFGFWWDGDFVALGRAGGAAVVGGTIRRMANDPAGRAHAGQMAPGREQWQVEGGAAELYQLHLVPAVTAGWAAGLADRAGLRRGERVLDVACGTGVVARTAAERVGRTGRVAGIDINTAMLDVARSLPAGAGARIDWVQGSVRSTSKERLPAVPLWLACRDLNAGRHRPERSQ